MDVLLHVAGFVANSNLDNGAVCICKEVKSAILIQELASPEELFEIHCNTLASPDKRAVIADAYAVDSKGVFAVFKGMVFQEVKQAKMNQAMRSTAKRLTGPKPRLGHENPDQPSTVRLQASMPKKAAPQSASSKPSLDIISIIATTCGVKSTTLSSDTGLSALGFDSLMMAELESSIVSQAGAQANLSALAECQTIGDVEQLCRSAMQVSHQSCLEKHNETPIPSPVPTNGPSVTSIIADTCGADLGSVMPNMELEALGIDSLMISELHSRLQDVSGNDTLSSTDLSECQTVADIEKMVGTTQ